MGLGRMASVPAPPLDVYLIADDLTGALDTAAQFVPLVGEIDVFWRPVEHDASGVRRYDASQDLNEGRLARAVLAENAVNAARGYY